jgi:hypothetical protein
MEIIRINPLITLIHSYNKPIPKADEIHNPVMHPRNMLTRKYAIVGNSNDVIDIIKESRTKPR